MRLRRCKRDWNHSRDYPQQKKAQESNQLPQEKIPGETATKQAQLIITDK